MSNPARFVPVLATLALLGASARASAQAPATSATAAQPAVAVPAAAPAATPALTGAWIGTLRAGPILATLHLTFAADTGAAGRAGHARLAPDGPQPALTGEIRDVVVSGRDVRFSVPTPEGTLRFTGAADRAGGLAGQVVVVSDGGAVEARGVWAAKAATGGVPDARPNATPDAMPEGAANPAPDGARR